MRPYVYILVVISCVGLSVAWDNEQLEVFDVVDEVKENFYIFLNLSQNATNAQIKSAFRKLTLQWHPDKNLNEDTSEKFRNLVSVYDVLKDEKKRGYYDDVLVNGLPNWKSAMYYYRRVRKMGIFEGLVLISAFFTVGQYIVAWAAYLEQKYTYEQQAKPKNKKQVFIMPVLEKPSMFHTLPFQIPKLIYWMIISVPSFVVFLKSIIAQKLEEATQPEEESEEEIVPKVKSKKKKQGFVIPEGPTFEEVKSRGRGVESPECVPPPVTGGFWSDDDLDELVQLVKKFPGGTGRRWELIAEQMNRSVAEVTFMANKLKNSPCRTAAIEEEEPLKVKQKTKGGKLGLEENAEEGQMGAWNHDQQKALEDALRKYPKGVSERWDRISDMVPDKTKEDCVMRFKFLAESIKKQKDL